MLFTSQAHATTESRRARLEQEEEVNTLTRDKSIVSHSILKKSEFNSDYQPVYYREEVLVIAQVSEKTTGIYRVTFTRSDDLGMASKFLIQSTVDSSQESIYKGLGLSII